MWLLALVSVFLAGLLPAGESRSEPEMPPEKELELLRQKARAQLAAYERYQRRAREAEEARRLLSGTRHEDARRALKIVETLFEEPGPSEPPGKATLWSMKGLALFQLGQKAPAKAAFANALQEDPTQSAARRNLGKILFAEGDSRGALRLWRHELAGGARDAELLYLVGQARYALGQYESALAAFQSCLVERAEDEALTRWLALGYYQTGRFAEALSACQRGLAANPARNELLELAANCHLRRGDYREAADLYESVRLLKGLDRGAHLALADLYAALELWEQAAREYAAAYAGEPQKMPDGDRLRLAEALSLAGLNRQALAEYAQLPRESAHYAEALLAMALIYRHLDRNDQALELVERARRHSGSGAAWLLAGDLYREAERFREAREAYAAASVIEGCQAEGYAGLAEVAYAEGSLSLAAELYRQALQLKPDERAFQIALGEIEREQERKAR